MQQKQAVTRECTPHHHRATKKAKLALLDEFIRLTGCHRKSAVRLLNARPVKPVMVYADGKAIKPGPGKKRPATTRESASIPVRSSLPSVWSGPPSGSNKKSAGALKERLKKPEAAEDKDSKKSEERAGDGEKGLSAGEEEV